MLNVNFNGKSYSFSGVQIVRFCLNEIEVICQLGSFKIQKTENFNQEEFRSALVEALLNGASNLTLDETGKQLLNDDYIFYHTKPTVQRMIHYVDLPIDKSIKTIYEVLLCDYFYSEVSTGVNDVKCVCVYACGETEYENLYLTQYKDKREAAKHLNRIIDKLETGCYTYKNNMQ